MKNIKKILRLARNTRRHNSIKYSEISLFEGFLYAIRVLVVLFIIVSCGMLKGCYEEHGMRQASDSEFLHGEMHSDSKAPNTQEYAEHPKPNTDVPVVNNNDTHSQREKLHTNNMSKQEHEQSKDENSLDDRQKELIIRKSIAAYIKTGHPCACPYSLMRNGRPW